MYDLLKVIYNIIYNMRFPALLNTLLTIYINQRKQNIKNYIRKQNNFKSKMYLLGLSFQDIA